VLNETSIISSASVCLTKRPFHDGQGTEPSLELDECAPEGGRQMEEENPPPAERQQSAENHKENETEVNDHHHIGKDSIAHGSCRAVLRAFSKRRSPSSISSRRMFRAGKIRMILPRVCLIMSPPARQAAAMRDAVASSRNSRASSRPWPRTSAMASGQVCIHFK